MNYYTRAVAWCARHNTKLTEVNSDFEEIRIAVDVLADNAITWSMSDHVSSGLPSQGWYLIINVGNWIPNSFGTGAQIAIGYTDAGKRYTRAWNAGVAADWTGF